MRKITMLFILVGLGLSLVGWQWERKPQGHLIIDGQSISVQALTVTEARYEYINPSLEYQGSATRFYVIVPHDIFASGWHAVNFSGQHLSFDGTFCKVNIEPMVGAFKISFRDDVRSCPQ